jgi:asparagine synthase (glutamine-hydrolysing)
VYSIDGKWLVAFNGEIYNFKQLIASHSLPFTDSDTKVIANGLQKYGINFLTQLRGMFAGIVIDTHANKTYFFRDPLGEKPLFLHQNDNELLISSEFTALLQILNRPLKLNPKAVTDYFRFGYVQEPDSFDREIISVKRGVVLELCEDSNLKEILHLDGYNDAESDLSLRDLLNEINSQVTYSTVPTGLALSAGVDSTSLLYAMSKHHETEFVPIIVNVSSRGLSQEALEAVESCTRLGIKPHLIHNSDSPDLVSRLVSLSAANDQPHADPSGLSYLTIFQVAKSLALKVVLLGHGPDEFFWGYPWFNDRLLKSRAGFSRENSNLPAYWDTPGKTPRLLWSLGYKEEQTFGDFAVDRYLQSENKWERYRAEMVHGYLSPNGLRQTDRLAMASGIEPRTPYADARLYGWAQRNSTKAKQSFDKREFRDSIELGPLNSNRNRKKEGFASPMGTWFQNPDVSEYSRSCLYEVSLLDLNWRFTPRFPLLSPSEKYRITMLGSWLRQLKTYNE